MLYKLTLIHASTEMFHVELFEFPANDDHVSSNFEPAVICAWMHCVLFVYFCSLLVCRCHECSQLEPEFAKAAAILKDHDPPVIFAQVCCVVLYTCVCYF